MTWKIDRTLISKGGTVGHFKWKNNQDNHSKLKVCKGDHPDSSIGSLFGNSLEFSLKDLQSHTEKINFTLMGKRQSFKVLDQGIHTINWYDKQNNAPRAPKMSMS